MIVEVEVAAHRTSLNREMVDSSVLLASFADAAGAAAVDGTRNAAVAFEV